MGAACLPEALNSASAAGRCWCCNVALAAYSGRYHLGPDEDVRDTIAMDEFENLVEEVVDHRKIGNSTSVRDFDFRVRWTGLGPEEDTWHPYMEMTRKGGLKAFWDYVELQCHTRYNNLPITTSRYSFQGADLTT